MLQLVEVSQVPAAKERPPSPPEHARLVLEELGVREKRVQELVEEDDGTEDEVEEGEEPDSEAEAFHKRLLLRRGFVLLLKVEAVLERGLQAWPFFVGGEGERWKRKEDREEEEDKKGEREKMEGEGKKQ